MSDQPIYLDYMATTPVDPRVKAVMVNYLGTEDVFGNPASNSHQYGWQAEEAVAKARLQVAELIGASSKEIVFTSGATEANNLALKGVAEFYQANGQHIITLKTEHKAVLDCLAALQAKGFEVTYLDPLPSGLVDLELLERSIRADTILISMMHVNNEIGVIQDVAAIATIAKKHGVIFHTDVAQSVGKVPLDMRSMPIDLLSMSAHKIYGPKGIGALYIRRTPRVHLVPQMHGGGHEFGFRAGTLATHQIVGMGEAFRLAQQVLCEENERICQQRDRLWQQISALGDIRLNGSATHRVSGNLNVFFAGVDGEALMLSLRRLAISSGSACNSANLQASHVLLALGLSKLEASQSLRISLGRFTSDDELAEAILLIKKEVVRLRAMAPRCK